MNTQIRSRKNRVIFTVTMAFFMVMVNLGCGSIPESGIERGKALFEGCVACHGPNGAGNQVLSAPAIAGMEPWYLEAQLKKFQEGVRGTHPADSASLRMRPMAMSLRGPNDISSIAAYVETLDIEVHTPTVTGDAAAGKTSYAVCVACHGDKGQGNKALNAPALTYMNDWYMVDALHKFKSGIRGTHPKDITGMTMRPMAMTLANEEAVNNVVAYINTLAP